MSDKSYITNRKRRGYLPTKVTPDIDFTDKPVVQSDASFAKIQKNVCTWLQLNDTVYKKLPGLSYVS